MTYAMFLVGLFQCAMLFILGRTGGKTPSKAARDRQEAERKAAGRLAKGGPDNTPWPGSGKIWTGPLKSLLFDQDYPWILFPFW